MLKITLFLTVLALPVRDVADDTMAAKPPLAATHSLAMKVEAADEPVIAAVQLSTKENPPMLILELPDGERVVTHCVLPEEGGMKFQWVRDARGKLATVHFIGNGKPDGAVQGAFTGIVDGQIIADMCGTFQLTPKQPGDHSTREASPDDTPAVDSRETPPPSMHDAFNPLPLDTPWARWLVGEWEGQGESDAGTGQATCRAELALGGQFLFVRGEGHDINITPEQREYLTTTLHASEEEITRFQAEAFQGLEIYTVDLQTGEVIGYLFDSLRCMAKGSGQWQQDALTMHWKWARGQESTRVTKKLSKDRASIVEHITLPDGGTMEEKGEMVRKE